MSLWYSIPKVFEAPNHTISFTTVYFVTAQRETKPLCETLGFAPLLIPWFTLFTLPSDNVVVCKQRRSIDRLSMIRNKIVLFMVAPFPTLIILNAINSIQPILRKETIRTPLLFCVFVWELWTGTRHLGAHTHGTSKEASLYKETELKWFQMR